MEAKPMWQSKTFWFNLITLIVMVAGAMSDPQTYGPEIAKYAALVLPVGNVVLRWMTKEPVSLQWRRGE